MLKASFKRHDEYPVIWRYVIAVALVLLALVLSDAVWDVVQDTPFQFFFAAVALSAWVGGMGPGLLAMALSIVLADYFLIPPLGVIFTVPSDIVQFMIFAAVALLVSWLDTARKRAVRDLQLARDELHILMDNIADAITAQDETGKVVFANQAAARLTGFDSAEHMLSATVSHIQAHYELIDEQGQPFPYEKLPRGRVFAENVSAEAQFRMRFLSDGHERWIHLLSAPVPGRDGKARLAVNIFRDVTETMQQQARLRQLLDNLPALVGMTTPDGILIEANRVALDIAGLKRDDVVGKPFDQTYWWAYDENVQAQLRDAITRAAQGERVHYDVKVRTGEHTFAIIDFSLAPIFDENGKVSALLPSAVDVTEHKQYEADREHLTLLLMQEQARLKGIVDNLPGVVWESLQNGAGQLVSTFVSDYTEQLFGKRVDEWLTNPDLLTTMLLEEDRDAVLAELAHAPEREQIVQYRIRLDDGTVKHVETRSRPQPTMVAGQMMVIGITTDITTQKDAEAQLAQLNARIDEERHRLDTIMVSVPGIVWEGVGKPDGYQRLVYVSPQVESILGYSREHWIDNANLWQEIVVPDDLPKAVTQAMSLFDAEKPGSVEFRVVSSDGRIIPVEARMTVMPDDARDDERHMCGVIMDISERKRSERRIANYAERLRRSNEELKQFAYVASHDLQEPLRMVSSYLQLLENRYGSQLEQDAKEFIGFAVDGATRMKQLIQDLLLYSRVETRKGEFTTVDMNQVLADVKMDLGVLIEETGATITSGALPVLTADQLQITQLLQNLINNAIKFRSEEAPCVEIHAEKVNNMWQFSVRDNGIGIEEKYKERIFEIFQRLHGRGKYPGTGIGLAICRRVVDRHGGRIWVESEADHGSTFYFTISNTLMQEQGDSNAEE